MKIATEEYKIIANGEVTTFPQNFGLIRCRSTPTDVFRLNVIEGKSGHVIYATGQLLDV